MIVDHVGITVSNYEQSKTFYTQLLAALEISLVNEQAGWSGYGKNGHAEFWIGQGKETKYFMHVAFVAENEAQVNQFYQAALEAGAMCNGKPRLRSDYYPRYYGAFVLDPDGHNIGVIFHL